VLHSSDNLTHLRCSLDHAVPLLSCDLPPTWALHHPVEVVRPEWSHDRQGARTVQQIVGEPGDVSRRDRIDAGDQLVDAEYVAVDEFALADPRHPGSGVLQAEHDRPAHLTLAPLHLGFGQAAFRDGGELAGYQRDHLIGLARLAARVYAEQAGVGVAIAERIDGVREAALFTNPLEQARAHATTECGREHAGTESPIIETRDSLRPQDDVRLFRFFTDDRRARGRPRVILTADGLIPASTVRCVEVRSGTAYDSGVIDVARDGHDNVARAIPAVVVAGNLSSAECGDRGDRTENGPPQGRVTEERRRKDVMHEICWIVVAHRDLFKYNAALHIHV